MTVHGQPESLGLKVRRVERAVDAVRGTAEAGDGAVRITLTADGRLDGLVLGGRALGLGAARLAALVVEAHERARTQARCAAEEVLRELTDDPLVARALDHAHPAESGAAPESAAAPGSARALDVPFDGRRLLADPLDRG
ncbi:YbaB/EbfC family nucleoid-associated protein [Rhodococcus tukisamuensis]|uniref:YbaB/EbfC DNA-binding family protein n=1 Tax=Rhodococcus tukisamuensis TaxID=168276 RepID=A0A1G6MRK8_9NOCA|nr:YbaB/EbfC family nucleoid-associated protein [Rhodococcus tukisamuensis]SDC57834.1 YbaB/EbfC DNA-binding family protein [Rhodococcus tukisamuensis]